MKKFEVMSCNPSNGGKTQVVKLNAKTTKNAGILEQVKSETYYISVVKPVKVGAKIELDIDTQFTINEHPYLVNGELPVDEKGELICKADGTPIMCKWLSLK